MAPGWIHECCGRGGFPGCSLAPARERNLDELSWPTSPTAPPSTAAPSTSLPRHGHAAGRRARRAGRAGGCRPVRDPTPASGRAGRRGLVRYATHVAARTWVCTPARSASTAPRRGHPAATRIAALALEGCRCTVPRPRWPPCPAGRRRRLAGSVIGVLRLARARPAAACRGRRVVGVVRRERLADHGRLAWSRSGEVGRRRRRRAPHPSRTRAVRREVDHRVGDVVGGNRTSQRGTPPPPRAARLGRVGGVQRRSGDEPGRDHVDGDPAGPELARERRVNPSSAALAVAYATIPVPRPRRPPARRSR